MYQNIIVIGRVGRDPEMRYLASGTAVTSFSLATTRTWNDTNGERQEETSWFRVSVFGDSAERANEYIEKGMMVLVEGRLRCDPKTGGPTVYTRKDGSLGSSFEIVARSIRPLSRPSRAAGGADSTAFEDDLAFDDKEEVGSF